MGNPQNIVVALLTTLALLAPPGLSGAVSTASKVTFELVPQSGAAGPVQGSLTLRPLSALGEPIVLQVNPEGRASAELPVRSSWEITADVPGRWAARKVFTLGSSGTEAKQALALWQVGKVSGSLKLSDDLGKGKGGMPGELAVKLQPPPLPPRKGEAPEGTVICPVSEKGTWVCDLPAAILDLSLRVEGFVPHYAWGAQVAAGKTLALGTIELKKGASVAGWVEIEGGEALTEGKGTARLLPLAAPGSHPATTARLQSTASQAVVDKRGFFQIGGLQPGRYILEVALAGYATSRIFPLEVWPAAETSLRQPVVLKRPLSLEIAISPPLDWLGQPWQAEVFHGSEFSARYDGEPAHDGPVAKDGRLVVPNQAPGTFAISIADSLGNRFVSQDLRVQSAEDARLSIEIDLISVRGKALFGKEPLAATLSFGGTNGAVRSVMEADAKGEFDGVLPREGVWIVDIRAQDPDLKTHAQVDIHADDRGRASVTLTVPDTHLHGKVVDEEGRPVPRASVSLRSQRQSLKVSTEDSGGFEVRGLPEGALTLAADHNDAETRWTSDEVFISVFDGQPVGPVELRLQKTKPLNGRVQSARGPVAGAAVLLFSRWPLLPFGRLAHTGLDGTFTADLPGKAETVVAMVSPPGNALKAFEFPANGMPVVFNVPPDGGALEVVLPYSPDEIRDLGLKPSIFQNGLPLQAGDLVKWARGHGEGFSLHPSGFRVPNLAPGDYRVCVASSGVMVEWETSAWLDQQGQGACATGYLEAGGRLRLELPRTRETRRAPGR